MLEVTQAATAQVAEYFSGQNPTPIRIFLNQGGWAGPGLAMALDEPKDTDQVYTIDGFTYLVDNDLLEKAKPIKVDFSVMGFKLDCAMDFGSSKSACGSCSSGSCGSWEISATV
jgi:iron-sulfur cluster assembly protein